METLVHELQDQLIDIINKTSEGEMTYLDATIQLRKEKARLEDALAIIKEFEDEAREQIEQEAKDYNNQYKGFKFEFRGGRKMYSFKNIPEWQETEAQKKAIENKYKSMLDAKLKGAVHANISEDGEELPLPEINYGKGSMIVKPLK